MKDKVLLLPSQPGVYIFKDQNGLTLYVGKANKLKSRVYSYFQKRIFASGNPRLVRMVSQINDLDWIVTDSELEAFLLEYQLIKKYKPLFNIRFRDDKRYPYIKLHINDPFPYVTVVRQPMPDGNRYFGPYVSSSALRKTLKLLRQIFMVRSCTKKITGHDRLCLYYHIKECSAPCIGLINETVYRQSISGITPFLEGKNASIIRQLKNEMKEDAKAFRFEEAAQKRDKIQALEKILEPQKIAKTTKNNQDIINFAISKDITSVTVFLVRDGKLIGKEHFILNNIETRKEEILLSFLQNYYGTQKEVKGKETMPSAIILPIKLKEGNLLKRWFKDVIKTNIMIKAPKKGENLQLLKLAQKNAELHLGQALLEEQKKGNISNGIEELAHELHLPRLPFRIEGFDISNLFGNEAVGSMVAFYNGAPKKDHYRKFKIKSVSGIDDYAMMGEIISRRFKEYLSPPKECLSSQEDHLSCHEGRVNSIKYEAFKEFPDLVLIDGGKGQLTAALKELDALHLREKVPILALAKEREEIYLPDMSEPIQLPEESLALKLLKQVRDEAHRFAVTYHRKLKRKSLCQT